MIKKTNGFFTDTIKAFEEKTRAVDKFYAAKSLAINIGSAQIEMMHVSKGYFRTKLIATHSFENPFSTVRERESEDTPEQLFVNGVSYFLKQTDYDWDEVIVGIPRNQMILKVISVPSPDRKMIPDILKYEIDKHIPFSANAAWYDFKILSSEEDNRYKVLLSISKNKVIEKYLDLLKQIGISPTIVDTSTNSLVNSYIFSSGNSKEFGQGNAILVHRDGSYLEIVLLVHKEILLSRTVQRQSLQTDESEPVDKQESDPLFAEFMFNEINKTCINHVHLFQNSDKQIPLILSGIKKTDIIESPTPYRAVYLDELPGIRGSKGHSIPTIGLALRGLVRTHMRIDLLPNSFKRRQNRYAGYITLCLLTTLILLIPVAGASVYFKELAKLEIIDSLLQEVKEEAASIENVYTTADELKKRYSSFQDLQKGATSKLRVLKELTTILPETIWIKTLEVKDKNVEINGFAERASGIITLLEESTLFTEAKFQGRITKKKSLEKFQLTATVVRQ